MPLPYLLSYPDPKLDEAYRRYQEGGKQRDIATTLGIPYRTLARRCSEDGWEAERKARRAEAETPLPAVLAAVAAEEKDAAAKVAAEPAASEQAASGTGTAEPTENAKAQAEPATPSPTSVTTATPVEPAEPEPDPGDSKARIDWMLRRQQRFASRLVGVMDRAAAELFRQLDGKPARAMVAQAAQILTLGSKALEMERRAYRVPDKVEVEDTTPTAADRVRKLKDDELQSKLTTARAARLEAERRRGAAAARGGSEAAGVN